MANKKYDLPAMPFYFGDWMKAPEVRALELGDRMIWFEILGFMWESTERGYLTINKKPIAEDMLARMLGLSVERLRVGLTAMDNLNIFSRRKDGAIYSRRMVEDNTKREKFREFGKKGGNPQLVGLRVGLRQGISSPENENENNIKKIEIFNYFTNKDYPISEAEKFFNHYESQGWVTGSGVPIKNWRLKAENWHKEQMRKNLEENVSKTKKDFKPSSTMKEVLRKSREKNGKT